MGVGIDEANLSTELRSRLQVIREKAQKAREQNVIDVLNEREEKTPETGRDFAFRRKKIKKYKGESPHDIEYQYQAHERRMENLLRINKAKEEGNSLEENKERLAQMLRRKEERGKKLSANKLLNPQAIQQHVSEQNRKFNEKLKRFYSKPN